MLITKQFLEDKGFSLCTKDNGYYKYIDDFEIILFDVDDENRSTQLHIEDDTHSLIILHLLECNTIDKLNKAFDLLDIKL